MRQRSQCNEVLHHLECVGHLDPMTALRRYGVMRLAARVCDLRDQGHEIHTQLFTANNGKRFARYYL